MARRAISPDLAVVRNSGSATGAEAVNLAADYLTETNSGRSHTRGVWVGGAGNVVVDMAEFGTNITFTGVPAGTLLPICVSKIYSTANGTTATSLTAIY